MTTITVDKDALREAIVKELMEQFGDPYVSAPALQQSSAYSIANGVIGALEMGGQVHELQQSQP